MKKIVSLIFTLALMSLLGANAFATANFVYHEQSGNVVASPTCPSGDPSDTCGRFVENADRNASPGYQVWSSEVYVMHFKVEFQFFTNQVRVYYTTDGSNPSGSFGTPFGTTQVANASYSCTYSDQSQGCQIVDVVTGIIPRQPAGTTVKYIVSAWHSGGGPEVFANSGTCGACFSCTDSTTGCAAIFQYNVLTDEADMAVRSDFDGDFKSDVAVWQGATSGNWLVLESLSGLRNDHLDWGRTSLGDIPVPGDYDDDDKVDYAVWRTSEGNWYIVKSSDGSVLVQNWGGGGDDVPVPGDYNHDGRTDYAVLRKSEGNWYVKLNGGASSIRNWGASGDIPVPGDYDGDGSNDYAIYRPSETKWYILNSATNTVTQRSWGLAGDKLVPADYDSDLKTDIAVYRPSEGKWYIRNSTTNTMTVRAWGNSTDIPVPADYDGDGKADIAVYRAGQWFIIRSLTNTASVVGLGTGADTPVPAMYLPQ